MQRSKGMVETDPSLKDDSGSVQSSFFLKF